MKIKHKHIEAFYERWGVSRKVKKELIGKKMNKHKLKALIASITITKPRKSLSAYGPDIKPYTFCPKCGCKESYTEDYHAIYPEVFYNDYCQRCNSWVGGADNSRHRHVLEDFVPYEKWITKSEEQHAKEEKEFLDSLPKQKPTKDGLPF